MAYLDGFVIPVRTEDREKYRAHEQEWWPSFRDAGALSFMVGWGDDVPKGQHTDFSRAVDLQEGETVVLALMTWPDKATRDAAYRAMEARAADDPSMSAEAMPFDGKRMFFGGFIPIVTEQA